MEWYSVKEAQGELYLYFYLYTIALGGGEWTASHSGRFTSG